MHFCIIHPFQGFTILTSLLLTNLFVFSNPAKAQRACVITDGGSVVCGRLQKSRNESSNPDVSKQRTSRGFIFDFKGCKRTEREEVTCTVIVTNTKPKARDLSFTIVSSIQMVDSGGSTYWWNRVGIGNQGNWATVPAGVPVKLTIVFLKVAPDTKSVLLTLSGRTDEGTTQVEFR